MMTISVKATILVIYLGGILTSSGAAAEPNGFGQHMTGWSSWFAGPLMMLVGLAILVAFIMLIVRLAKCLSEDFLNRRNRLVDFGLRGWNRL
jgi:uncharacterized membrane protein